MTYKKKLIEVALPLPEINDASAYDKMPGIGPHPKGIHHWWARLPLPTARAVLFASVVDDPSENPDRFPTEEAQSTERERLFDIIRRMMQKRLHKHPEVYAEAHAEMLKHCDGKLPPLYDPFAGGGSIPLEANRLGFEAHAGDLNPVAVLLNKCNLELAPRCAGHPPVNPEDRKRVGGTDAWPGTQGLAADVRYYGGLIRDRARAEIGHLYPKVLLPKQYGSSEANVVAWIWARTVASPNPAARGKHVPLITTYWLCSKGKNLTWLHPVVDRSAATYRFDIQSGAPSNRNQIRTGTKIGRGANFSCILTDQPIPDDHVKSEGQAGRLRFQLLAVVAKGNRGRLYLPTNDVQEQTAAIKRPDEGPQEELPYNSRYLNQPGYGMSRVSDLFTPRQLTAMIALAEQVRKSRAQIQSDALSVKLSQQEADSYANTVISFLGLAVDRCTDFNNALCGWSPSNQKVMHLFGRGAIPIIWDFAEANLLGESVGAWSTCCDYVAECIEALATNVQPPGSATQVDAATGVRAQHNLLISTDPPYYDNIPYAAISDFFYVWLRRSIGDLHPQLFATVLVPKQAELTADPARFDGDDEAAKEHFEEGFRRAFLSLRTSMDTRFPLTVYYAFRQEDEDAGSDRDGNVVINGVDLTTGWETLLEALVSSGFQITGTWPVRASQQWRMRAMSSNALASYIVLACRPRPSDAPRVDRRSFITELKRELPSALRHLQQGNIAPVDFAQAAIGPGMAVYSRFSGILESTGKSMTVRIALSLINQTLTEVLSEQEDEFDADTRWALAWFEQSGFAEGEYGVAETLSKAKNTSVAGMVEAGILVSKGGKVRLLRPDELSGDWDPRDDGRLNVWEMVHQLVRALEKGETTAAELVAKLGSKAETARELAYRLYTICKRKKRAQEALGYNALVQSWPEILRLAREAKGPAEGELF